MLKSLKSNATESAATHGACCTLRRGRCLWQCAMPGGEGGVGQGAAYRESHCKNSSRVEPSAVGYGRIKD